MFKQYLSNLKQKINGVKNLFIKQNQLVQMVIIITALDDILKK